MNSISLVGRLARDPEVGYTANTQMANARFVVAVNRKLSKEKRREAENNRYSTVDFISYMVWGEAAENIGNYFHKGNRITITGHIQTGSYEDRQGRRIYTTDVVADSFDFTESNSNNSATNREYSNPVDLGMSGQESFDSGLPF